MEKANNGYGGDGAGTGLRRTGSTDNKVKCFAVKKIGLLVTCSLVWRISRLGGRHGTELASMRQGCLVANAETHHTRYGELNDLWGRDDK